LDALLQPVSTIQKLEVDGDNSSRLAFVEEFKAAPFMLVWDYLCEKTNTGVSLSWLEKIKQYEKDELSKR